MTDFVIPPTWDGDPRALVDEPSPRRLVGRDTIHHGLVWDLRRDRVDLGDGQTVAREYVAHPGAVAVLALDDADRVCLIRQYRHPVGMLLWEPVAGLLDVEGEPPLEAAARELVEEAGLMAERWHVLVDLELSPGGSSEALRLYLARGLSPAPGGRPDGQGEERDLPHTWVPLHDAVRGVLAGRLTAPMTVSGVLAAYAARAHEWRTLRAADEPWPAREWVDSSDRVRSNQQGTTASG